jgi:small GTP-binding protein
MLIGEGALVFRVVLIGNSSVGKTSLVRRFLHNEFNPSEANTIGASYETYTEVRDGFSMELQIWDTAGQEKFKSLGPIYYREASAAIAVFDLSNSDSFEGLSGWIDSFRSVAGSDAVIVVVGNKLDLVDVQKVTLAEAEQWCAGHEYGFVPASAKTAAGVADIFDRLLAMLADRRDDTASHGVQRFVAPPLEPSESGRCC